VTIFPLLRCYFQNRISEIRPILSKPIRTNLSNILISSKKITLVRLRFLPKKVYICLPLY